MDSLTAGGGGPLETAVRLLSASLSWVILSWSVATLGGEEVVVRNSSSCSVATLTSCSSRSVKLSGPVSGARLRLLRLRRPPDAAVAEEEVEAAGGGGIMKAEMSSVVSSTMGECCLYTCHTHRVFHLVF